MRNVKGLAQELVHAPGRRNLRNRREPTGLRARVRALELCVDALIARVKALESRPA